MTKVSNERKNLSRLAGEFLVASRLTQRGYMVALQWGTTIGYDILVFDKAGNFLRSFGEDTFTARAHGISVSPDGFVYCVDDSQHAVHKFTTEGKLVWTLGEVGKPAPKWSGTPFNRPTHAAVSPKSGDIFVSDGYGNSMVHRFSPEGRLITSWGGVGCEPGEFQHPHAIVVVEQPEDRVCCLLDNVELTCLAESPSGLGYQWYHDDKVCRSL